jgi:hypothetical protein
MRDTFSLLRVKNANRYVDHLKSAPCCTHQHFNLEFKLSGDEVEGASIV